MENSPRLPEPPKTSRYLPTTSVVNHREYDHPQTLKGEFFWLPDPNCPQS